MILVVGERRSHKVQRPRVSEAIFNAAERRLVLLRRPVQEVELVGVQGAEWEGIVGKGGISLKTFADQVIEERSPEFCDFRIETTGVLGQTRLRSKAHGVLSVRL